MSILRSCVFLSITTLAWSVAIPAAHAADPVELVSRPHVRVIAEAVQIYSGPGFSFRAIASVSRDDVLEMIERGKRGGWTRVKLPTGLTGWVLTEQITIFGEVKPGPETRGQRAARKLRENVFGPPTLLSSRFGAALSAGALGFHEGLFLVRPSVLIDPHFALEAYLGPSVGPQTNRGLFGLSGNVYLSPEIPVTVFLSVGAGAVLTRSKADDIANADWSYLASPGGGFMLIFKRGVTLRFDARSHVLFRADQSRSLMELSGALAFHF
jgi:hypothetical protein